MKNLNSNIFSEPDLENSKFKKIEEHDQKHGKSDRRFEGVYDKTERGYSDTFLEYSDEESLKDHMKELLEELENAKELSYKKEIELEEKMKKRYEKDIDYLYKCIDEKDYFRRKQAKLIRDIETTIKELNNE
jgi:hypothetical protein